MIWIRKRQQLKGQKRGKEAAMNISYHKMNQHERPVLVASITEHLKKEGNISFAYVFGSFKDYDDAVGFVDIDIAVYLIAIDDNIDYTLGLAAELSYKYHLPVECLPINEAPLFFRYRIFKEGTLLFCKDENLLTDMIEETVNNALDFMPLREEAMRELA